jgi:hypothetical protein
MYKPREDREIVVISGMIRQLEIRMRSVKKVKLQSHPASERVTYHMQPAMLVAMHEVVGGVEKAGIETNINTVDPFTTRQRRGRMVLIRLGDWRTLTLAQW